MRRTPSTWARLWPWDWMNRCIASVPVRSFSPTGGDPHLDAQVGIKGVDVHEAVQIPGQGIDLPLVQRPLDPLAAQAAASVGIRIDRHHSGMDHPLFDGPAPGEMVETMSPSLLGLRMAWTSLM